MAVLKPDTGRASDPDGRTLCAPTERNASYPPLRETSRRRRPQTAAQRSGCRLERRSKGAGEECPPGRSEIKRTLLRRHGRSQAGRGVSRAFSFAFLGPHKVGRRIAPYKRFCRRQKPWRRANSLRPSIEIIPGYPNGPWPVWAGKKKMRTLGTVQLPTEAFMAVLKLDEE